MTIPTDKRQRGRGSRRGADGPDAPMPAALSQRIAEVYRAPALSRAQRAGFDTALNERLNDGGPPFVGWRSMVAVMVASAAAVLIATVATLEPAEPPSGLPCRGSGAERAEFLFTANKGGSAQPLRMVASGGELSRVSLAVFRNPRSHDRRIQDSRLDLLATLGKK